MQRATGLIAFLFIGWHVFHMHGWFHNSVWLDNVATPLAGAQFRPYNAASSAALAMQASFIVPLLYAIGVLACVYHLANGIFTFGITWGLWISPKAQGNAKLATNGIGIVVAVLGILPIVGLTSLKDTQAVRGREDKAYELMVETGEIQPNEHKRLGGHEEHPSDEVGLGAK